MKTKYLIVIPSFLIASSCFALDDGTLEATAIINNRTCIINNTGKTTGVNLAVDLGTVFSSAIKSGTTAPKLIGTGNTLSLTSCPKGTLLSLGIGTSTAVYDSANNGFANTDSTGAKNVLVRLFTSDKTTIASPGSSYMEKSTDALGNLVWDLYAQFVSAGTSTPTAGKFTSNASYTINYP